MFWCCLFEGNDSPTRSNTKYSCQLPERQTPDRSALAPPLAALARDGTGREAAARRFPGAAFPARTSRAPAGLGRRLPPPPGSRRPASPRLTQRGSPSRQAGSLPDPARRPTSGQGRLYPIRAEVCAHPPRLSPRPKRPAASQPPALPCPARTHTRPTAWLTMKAAVLHRQRRRSPMPAPRTAGLAPRRGAARARTASRAARPGPALPCPARAALRGRQRLRSAPPRPASPANHPRSRRARSVLSVSPSAA